MYIRPLLPFHSQPAPFTASSSSLDSLTRASQHPSLSTDTFTPSTTPSVQFSGLPKKLKAWFNRRKADSAFELTPLGRAASEGQTKRVRKLVQSGVDVNEAPGPYCLTALHRAAARGHTETVRVLVEELKADVSKTNRDGRNPLDVALQGSYFWKFDPTKIINILKKGGAIPANTEPLQLNATLEVGSQVLEIGHVTLTPRGPEYTPYHRTLPTLPVELQLKLKSLRFE